MSNDYQSPIRTTEDSDQSQNQVVDRVTVGLLRGIFNNPTLDDNLDLEVVAIVQPLADRPDLTLPGTLVEGAITNTAGERQFSIVVAFEGRVGEIFDSMRGTVGL